MSKKLTLADLQQQVTELTQALQRERADSLNLHRRAEEEKAGMGNYYKAAIVRELLPAVDNLERALIHVPKDLKDHDYVKGVQGVIKQFENCFKQLVEELQPGYKIGDEVIRHAMVKVKKG